MQKNKLVQSWKINKSINRLRLKRFKFLKNYAQKKKTLFKINQIKLWYNKKTFCLTIKN